MHRKAPISGGNESAVPMHHLSCRGPVNARLNYRPLSVRGEGEGGDKRVYKRGGSRAAVTGRRVGFGADDILVVAPRRAPAIMAPRPSVIILTR